MTTHSLTERVMKLFPGTEQEEEVPTIYPTAPLPPRLPPHVRTALYWCVLGMVGAGFVGAIAEVVLSLWLRK